VAPQSVLEELTYLRLVQISFSGCKDSQTSADTVEAGQATGAMSFVRRRRHLLFWTTLIS
jgi:hypothetical protein